MHCEAPIPLLGLMLCNMSHEQDVMIDLIFFSPSRNVLHQILLLGRHDNVCTNQVNILVFHPFHLRFPFQSSSKGLKSLKLLLMV